MMAPEIGKYLAFLWFILVLIVVLAWFKNCCWEQKIAHDLNNQGRQDNDVWNISGRMNSHSQNLDSWPTHDHHVSIDSFAFPPDYQAKDPRLAPPPYTEVDLPTYEEAVACANNKNSQQPAPVHTITITRHDPPQ